MTTITIRGKSTLAITTPKVLEKARAFFNCSTLVGLELEDQGGSGTAKSHWDKRVAMNELMVGFGVGGEFLRSLADYTLAYFDDSGHYDVDYTQSDNDDWSQLYFGRGAGCDFINKPCNQAPAKDTWWCWDQTDEICTKDFLLIGKCNTANYTTRYRPTSSTSPTPWKVVARNTPTSARSWRGTPTRSAPATAPWTRPMPTPCRLRPSRGCTLEPEVVAS